MTELKRIIWFVMLAFAMPQIVFGQFEEISLSSGVEHCHITPTTMGGGAVFFDYNNDGFLDLYATNADDHDLLYENQGDGTFYDVSIQSNIKRYTINKYSFSAISGDVNNDGWDDLFISTYDFEQNNILLLNNGDGTFTDISLSSGIVETTLSSGATFIDYNKDGLLDIYVINYIDEFIFIKDENDIIVDIDRSCLPNHFYINKGNNTFEEVAAEYGVDNFGCGLAIQAVDYDLDGDQDIYVVNDHGMHVVPNTLYQNNYPDNSFTDVSEGSGLNVGMFGMGVATRDFNEDGEVDFYVSNLGNNVLLSTEERKYRDFAEDLSLQNGHYEDGVSITGWGTFFFDFDNDIDLDLFVTNGYIRTGYFGFRTEPEDKNAIFLNNGDGTFTDMSIQYSLNDPSIGRGASIADYDRDGDVDFFVVNTSEAEFNHSLLYKNQLETNNWIEFDLEGDDDHNRNAFGAKVYVNFDSREIYQELMSGGSFASQHAQILHFGLAQVQLVNSVKVVWPDQSEDIFENVNVNQIYYLKKGSGSLLVSGCTDPEALNYNPDANYNSACQYPKISGCTDPFAFNFNKDARIDDGSCSFTEVILTGLDDSENGGYKLFPNPSANKISLYGPLESIGKLKKIQVLDPAGRIVLEQDDWNSDKMEFDVSNLRSGIYHVILREYPYELQRQFKFIKP